MTGLQVPVTVEIEDHEPDIAQIERGIRIGQDGNLWMICSRGTREQPPGIFLAGKGRAVVVKGYITAMAAQFGRGNSNHGACFLFLKPGPQPLDLVRLEIDAGPVNALHQECDMGHDIVGVSPLPGRRERLVVYQAIEVQHTQ